MSIEQNDYICSMHGRAEPKGDLRFEPTVQLSLLCSHSFFLQFFSLLLPLHWFPFLVTSPSLFLVFFRVKPPFSRSGAWVSSFCAVELHQIATSAAGWLLCLPCADAINWPKRLTHIFLASCPHVCEVTFLRKMRVFFEPAVASTAGAWFGCVVHAVVSFVAYMLNARQRKMPDMVQQQLKTTTTQTPSNARSASDLGMAQKGFMLRIVRLVSWWKVTVVQIHPDPILD